MKRFFYAVVAILFISSCSVVDDDEPNFNFVALKVIDAELPDAFNLNETYEIEVTYERPNGCTYFEGFDVDKEDQTVRKVVVVGSEFTDRACTEQIEHITEVFRFIVLYNETYTFRFFTGENANGENEYLEVLVPVN